MERMLNIRHFNSMVIKYLSLIFEEAVEKRILESKLFDIHDKIALHVVKILTDREKNAAWSSIDHYKAEIFGVLSPFRRKKLASTKKIPSLEFWITNLYKPDFENGDADGIVPYLEDLELNPANLNLSQMMVRINKFYYSVCQLLAAGALNKRSLDKVMDDTLLA